MLDHRNILTCLASYFNIMIGLITLNNAAIFVGILSGLSVIASNIFSNILKYKEYKKNVNRSDK